MPTYMIGYDPRTAKHYDALTQQLSEWNCVRPLESLWFGSLNGDALTIRERLRALIGGNDGLVVCEIKPSSDWAGVKLHEAVTAWVRANIGQ